MADAKEVWRKVQQSVHEQLKQAGFDKPMFQDAVMEEGIVPMEKLRDSYRLHFDPLTGERSIIYHDDEGKEARLDPRRDLRHHSPDGFSWGYAGSGPAQAALAIAAHALGDEDGQRVYQAFKWDVIAGSPMDISHILAGPFVRSRLRQGLRDIETRGF
jgi:hypothetical protein